MRFILYPPPRPPAAFGQMPGAGCEELLLLYTIILLLKGQSKQSKSRKEPIQAVMLCMHFSVQVTIS